MKLSLLAMSSRPQLRLAALPSERRWPGAQWRDRSEGGEGSRKRKLLYREAAGDPSSGLAIKHPANLDLTYAGLAEVRGVPVETLAAQVEANFLNPFGPLQSGG